ncbi:MICOS complex subunit mic10 [Golovinomyces cichoracearum]|uniref:MICOS complex subunit MIC10 n=1 Tax=Golovinomyces cichoracearum TaxID=62708 RepID=A0A420IBX6_9PEZI|nr:MICOS complex subunit mic10 [Golovinomyces cichoracearum]
MPENTGSPSTTGRPSKPVSEAILNEKWDRCLALLFLRSTVGLSFGVIFSFILFRRRAWPAFLGAGFGAGRAYEECNNSFLYTHRKESKDPS